MFNRQLTVERVLSGIRNKFPTMSNQKDINSFLVKNHEFVKSLVNNSDEDRENMLRNKETHCEVCNTSLKKWRENPNKSYFLSLGEIKVITIQVLMCENCEVLVYPHLYSNGIIPLHNKFLVSFDFFEYAKTCLATGAPLIETMERHLKMLMRREGLSEEIVNKDTKNLASRLERLSVAVTAALITGEDIRESVFLKCHKSPNPLSLSLEHKF